MEKAPTHLDLFSGIGGFALACRWAGFRTVAFCEIDEWCRKVLARHFDAPIHSDIFDFDGTAFRGVDLITGGFPCQPFSVAGKRGGAGDDRAIWPEMFRVIGEARPAWVLGENVPGIVAMELNNVLSDLEGIGYATRAFIVPACAVDARHRRDRVWIVGRLVREQRSGWRCPTEERFRSSLEEIGDNATLSDPKRQRGRSGSTGGEDAEDAGERSQGERLSALAYPDNTGQQQGDQANTGGSSEQSDGNSVRQGDVGNPECTGLQGELSPRIDGAAGREIETGRVAPTGGVFCRWRSEEDWFTQSGMGRVANGVSRRVDRLKGLGNAIVPQVAYEILREIRRQITP